MHLLDKKKIFFECIVYLLITSFFFNLLNSSFFYGDDFTMLKFNEKNYFLSFIQVDAWWRPFKNIFYNFFNINFFLQSQYILIAKFLFHVSIFIVIYRFFYKTFNKCNILILLIFFIHQSSVISVFGIDTFGQQFAAFFGLLSFIYLYEYIKINPNRNTLIKSLLFYFLCLLGKENGLSFFFVNSFIILIYSNFNFYSNEVNLLKKNKSIKLIFLFFILTLIYLLLREYLGAEWKPKISNDRYSVGYQALFQNFIFYFFAIFNPIDNSLIFKLVNEGKYLNSLIIFSVSIVFLLIFFILKNLKKNYVYIGILFFSGFPIFFLGHISELYVYQSIFFFIFLLQVTYNNLIKKKFFNFLLIIFIILSTISFGAKTYNIKLNFIFTKNIFDYMSSLKNSNKEIFYNSGDNFQKGYSIYLINDFYNFIPRFLYRDFFNFDVLPLPYYEYELKQSKDPIIIYRTKGPKNKIKNNFYYKENLCLDFINNSILLKRVCKF